MAAALWPQIAKATTALLEGGTSISELLRSLESNSASLEDGLRGLFVGDGEALDTLGWCTELLGGFGRDAAPLLEGVRHDEPIPEKAIEEFARDRRFGGLLRGIALLQALAVMSDDGVGADEEQRERAVAILNAAFLELCAGVDAFRFAGLAVQPFASEGPGRAKRFQRAAADLRAVVTPDDERALELARLHTLR